MKILFDMSRDQGHIGSDLVTNLDNIIVESKDEIELLMPSKNEISVVVKSN